MRAVAQKLVRGEGGADKLYGGSGVADQVLLDLLEHLVGQPQMTTLSACLTGCG